MQPYPNPNYFTQYQQPQFNPYMQRMENLQQFQQALQQPNMATQQNQFQPLGKIVESIDIVKVTDIPMDGNVYYFPKADGSEIYSKQFLPNGQTRILAFKPLLEDEPNNLPLEEEKLKIGISDEVTEAFMDVLNQINKRLDLLENNLSKNSTKTKAKKESVEDAE